MSIEEDPIISSKTTKRKATVAKTKRPSSAVKWKIITGDPKASARRRVKRHTSEVEDQGPPKRSTGVFTTTFLDLPAELRNEIYTYALVERIPIDVNHSRPYLREPAMLFVSRQVRPEALSVWYGENKFLIEGSSPAVKFLRSLAPLKLRCLRNVLVSVTNISPASYARERISKMMHEFGRGGMRRQAIHFEVNAVGYLEWMNLDQLEDLVDQPEQRFASP